MDCTQSVSAALPYPFSSCLLSLSSSYPPSLLSRSKSTSDTLSWIWHGPRGFEGASVVVDYYLMGGCRVGKSRIVEVASFKGVARERAAIGVPSYVVRNRSHPHKAAGTGFVSCSLRKVGVH